MRSTRAILSVKYTAVGARAASAVAGFLRYVQFRDHHERPEAAVGVEGLTRYVAYRDQASPQGRLFDSEGTIGDRERRQLVAYVRRSTAHAMGRQGRPARAVYRLVISPEDARGLDLKRVARAAMDDLALRAGGLPPWIAAEHRNTAHPHVHVVLPAFREVAPGRFRQVIITKPRLASMKAAMSREIQRQRGVRSLASERSGGTARIRPRHDRLPRRHRSGEWRSTPRGLVSLTTLLLRAGARYRTQSEREIELRLFRRAQEARERDQEMER